MKPMFSRGPSLQLRLFIAAIAAIALIIADSRFGSFVKIRTYMDTLVSPFYFLANGPRVLLDGVSETLATRQQIELENSVLRQELLFKNADLQLLKQFKHENIRLRELLGSPLRQDEHKMVTQVMSSGTDPYSDQVVIDKGSNNGVYEGQPVISDRGVVGQVTAVSKFTSRVVLICDISHALPIQVLRNDIRVIAAGGGCADDLILEHLPSNTDIRVGDMLVTSGLGGRFSEGYPVAIVSSVKVDNQRAYTMIQARPTADLQRLRYLLLLWAGDRHGDTPLAPDAVHQVAKERLTQMADLLHPRGEWDQVKAPTPRECTQIDENCPYQTTSDSPGTVGFESTTSHGREPTNIVRPLVPMTNTPSVRDGVIP
ncbi:rod shape-determining protein MreC [Candidatus Fukatsuia endosymbiont of Tuberolachnus salignus]|uniref:rod shape-determining protein MreC n=1 Tax=Candidatus Fukatsuia endosymbiont of Tuberolachnus salignus TaxID=3077957 RepID=UPI00313B9360